MEHARKTGLLTLHTLILFIVVLTGRTSSFAENNLKGCWVGNVSGETTYLWFYDNSSCAFNQDSDNCTVIYPLPNDERHNIQLDYEDDNHNLQLLGNVDKDEIRGDSFDFSRGTTCPLPN